MKISDYKKAQNKMGFIRFCEMEIENHQKWIKGKFLRITFEKSYDGKKFKLPDEILKKLDSLSKEVINFYKTEGKKVKESIELL